MSSPERKISVVPPPGTEPVARLESRLASLEAEADRLRAELAALHDDIRWLMEEDGEGSGDPAFISHGWLARGWVRASLLLVAVGFVALVSVPYLLHQLDPSGRPGEPAPAPAASSLATPQPRTSVAPATLTVAPGEPAPAPVRVRASETPDPVRARPEAPRHDHDATGPGAATSPAPVRDVSP